MTKRENWFYFSSIFQKGEKSSNEKTQNKGIGVQDKKELNISSRNVARIFQNNFSNWRWWPGSCYRDEGATWWPGKGKMLIQFYIYEVFFVRLSTEHSQSKLIWQSGLSDDVCYEYKRKQRQRCVFLKKNQIWYSMIRNRWMNTQGSTEFLWGGWREVRRFDHVRVHRGRRWG